MTVRNFIVLGIFFLFLTGFIGKTPRLIASGEDLASVQIWAGGKLLSVKPGETLNLVRGDRVRIKQAVLVSGKMAKQCNFIGFWNRNEEKPGSDQGYLIETDSRLAKSFSVHKSGRLFRVMAVSGSVLHGEIFVRLSEPLLETAVIKIGGKVHNLKNGDRIKIGKSDLLKVDAIKTNVEKNDGVHVQFIKNKRADQPYQMVFKRYQVKMGEITVETF